MDDKTTLRAWRDFEAPSATAYDRAHLPGLIAVWPNGAALTTRRIVAMLSRALRRERANQGRWTYNVRRHAALAQARRIEAARLDREMRGAKAAGRRL